MSLRAQILNWRSVHGVFRSVRRHSVVIDKSTDFRVLSYFIGIVSSIWIPLAISIKILLILMALDMITGIVLAARNRKIASSIGFRGVTKKSAILIVVMTAYIMQHLAEGEVGNGFMFPVKLGAAVALAYDVIEAISVIENCHSLGAPIPSILSRTLHRAGKLVQDEEPLDYRDRTEL